MKDIGKKKKIGVLASGGGSNMRAIMNTIDKGDINGEIIIVISDNLQANALNIAKERSIDTKCILPEDYSSRADFSTAIFNSLEPYNLDLLLLAGFMRVITNELIIPFYGKILNIHPSLIPSFCGKGYYGHHVHEAVIKKGVKFTGCTVHFVTEEVDGGPIIIQRIVPVSPDDTPDTVAAQVLIEEHIAFPEAVKLFCDDEISIDNINPLI